MILPRAVNLVSKRLRPFKHPNNDPTKVVKAVLPAPLGPRSRKLLEGGDATAWKKIRCNVIGTPKVKIIAMAMATRLPSNSNVAMPVTESQPALLDIVVETELCGVG
jgi:hypothetical protein